VTVKKLISKNTIEEQILKCGRRKLKLEGEIVSTDYDDSEYNEDSTRQQVLKMLQNMK